MLSSGRASASTVGPRGGRVSLLVIHADATPSMIEKHATYRRGRRLWPSDRSIERLLDHDLQTDLSEQRLPHQVNRAGVTRLVRVAVIVLALVAFALHAWQALAGAYLSYVSGIWLALGRDLSAGLFYRDLSSDVGYGGTRYFPLFFSLIGLFMRAGLAPLAAGWIASACAALILATGLFRVARGLKLSRDVAILLGVGGLAPGLRTTDVVRGTGGRAGGRTRSLGPVVYGSPLESGRAGDGSAARSGRARLHAGVRHEGDEPGSTAVASRGREPRGSPA